MNLFNSRSKLQAFLALAALGLIFSGAARAQIFVNSLQNGTISEYDATTGTLVNASLVSGLNGPSGLAVSGNDLFVLNTGTTNNYEAPPGPETLSEYTTSGALVNASVLSGLSGVDGFTLDGSDLFLLDSGNGTISEYTTAGATVNASLISGLSNPTSVAVSGSDIFVMNNGSGTVGEYATSGAVVNAALITGLGSSDIGVQISGSDLYVSDFFDDTISEYTTSGTAISTPLISLTSGLSGPAQMKLVGSDLYVMDNGNALNGSIGIYTTSGATVNSAFITGLVTDSGFAIATSTGPSPLVPTSTMTGVPAGGSYSSVAPLTATGGLGTKVSLVAGTASSNKTVTLSTTRLGSNFTSLASDVVSVSGNDGDVFAVQLTFNPSQATAVGGAGNMALLWLNPANDVWELAVGGDHGNNTTLSPFLDFNGSFAQFQSDFGANDSNLSNYLGAYGVDTTNDTVWAVIDHNSDFGVGNPGELPQPVATPEPSTWALLLGGFGLLAFRWGRLKRVGA